MHRAGASSAAMRSRRTDPSSASARIAASPKPSKSNACNARVTVLRLRRYAPPLRMTGLFWCGHVLGHDDLVVIFFGHVTEVQRRFFERTLVMVRVLGDFRGFVVT